VEYYLRFVKARDFSDSDNWSSSDDVPENAVRHFRNDGDELSIFRFECIEDVGRIVAAFAAADRERAKPRDAIYIPAGILDCERISVTATDGELLDAEVSGWHRSLSGLNEEVSRMLTVVFGTEGACCQFNRAEVCELIMQSVDRGYLAECDLSDGVRRDLQKHRQRGQE
jgi:hypothetical protein